MKVAVVLYGIAGGMVWRNGIGETINIEDCAKTIRYNLISHYDCDVFLHSWSIKERDRLISAFNPVSYIIEPQEMFGYSEGINHNVDQREGFEFRCISRWTSSERAMSLKLKYELENNIRYDWVILARIDLIYFKKIELSNYSQEYFYICRDPFFGDGLWAPDRNVPAIDDRIFMANSDNMDKFCTIAQDIRDNNTHGLLNDPHGLALKKLMEMFGGDRTRLQFGFHRFTGVDIYRSIVNDFSGGRESQFKDICVNAGVDMKANLDALLLEINGQSN